MACPFTIYSSVPVVIVEKTPHVRKIGGRLHSGFCRDYADVPVGTLNPVTKSMEAVDNPRGRGYALRRALRNRRNKLRNARSVRGPLQPKDA